ncbi:MAG: hypothetical protein NVV82_19380 [Sporocytophaga sp.]|nr:hypothetical protein [Sporocytophaga sp.]
MKLLRKKIFIKGVSVFLMISFLNTIIFPTISFALTSGPTAPEYTSFEPVDTTDMVDLATGDLTYNIPLLEVPGSEGGYPLGLSYHALVTPDQESSWTGLGWNINPGAINRMANGHPDDLLNANQVITDSWPGGNTKMYSVGVGIYIFNVGLQFATDTYRGLGVGGYAGVGYPLGNGMQMGVFAGVSPYGDASYAGMGVYLGSGVKSMGLGGNVGSVGAGVMLTSSSKGEKVQGFVSASAGPVMDISLKTGNDGYSSSMGGMNLNMGTGKTGSIKTNSTGFGITIPLYYFTISLGYNYSRYWMNALNNASLYGSLYAPNLSTTPASGVSFDCTSMISENSTSPIETNPDQVMGGSKPAFDSYIVSGQGIGGAMQPYYYESGSMSRRDVPIDYSYKTYQNKVSFRFVNDFSNSCVYNTDSWASPTLSSLKNIVSAIGKNKRDYTNDSLMNFNMDFNKPKGMLSGSRYIEWFTNAEIRNNKYKESGYVKYCPFFMPDQKGRLLTAGGYQLGLDNHIGGFVVTNESGVSYHYTIPVYNFENTTKIFGDNNFTRTIERKSPYAYTWLLTAITGPDFVDRGIFGEFDEADFGYWVKFDYGRWTNQYKWRTPETGNEIDNIARTQVYTTGKKELYYLNSIRTRTHTALFVKSIKDDGKSVSDMDNGGFDIKRDGNNNVTAFSVSSLKLDKILILNNSLLTEKLIQNFQGVSSLSELNQNGNLVVNFGGVNYHNGDDILDASDLTSNLKTSGYDLSKEAIKQIVFTYDYGLCKNTPNSYVMDYFSYSKGPLNGKLTLTKVEYLGKNGESIIPSTQFEYGTGAKNPDYSQNKDIWGSYKSDYPTGTGAENIENHTTIASSANVDAWSLTKVKTGLGAEINITYESDKHYKSVLNNFRNLSIKKIEKQVSINQFKIYFHSSELLTNYSELYVGKKVSLRSLISKFYLSEFKDISRYDDDNAEIMSIGSDYLILNTLALSTYFNATGLPPGCPNPFDCLMLTGNVFFDRNASEYNGGGLRVKSIGVKDGTIENLIYYEYLNGVTACEPSGFNVRYNVSYIYDLTSTEAMNMRKNYENDIYRKFLKTIAGQQVMSPGVIYSKVLVREKMVDSYSYPREINGTGFTEYVFSTMDDSWIPREERTLISDATNKEYAKLFKINDFRGRVGLLKSVTKYGANNVLLSKTEQTYLHDQAGSNFVNDLSTRFKNQGRIDQVYFERRDVNGDKQLMITEVEEYPVIPVGSKYTDYKRGIVQESKILGYDFYSGNVNCEISKDAFGKEYKSKTVYAYEKFPAMGSKIFNNTNKNMLSQTTGSYLYRVDANKANPVLESDYNETGLVGAQVDYWTNSLKVEGLDAGTTQPDIWRKKCSYYWVGEDTVALNPNGTYKVSKFPGFNYSTSTNNFWQQTGEITLIDPYSHVLESQDINGLKSSLLMNPKRQYLIASSGGASRNEIAYMSCEFPSEYPSSGIYEGNTEVVNGKIFNDSNFAHTGKYSLQVPSGKDGFKFRFTPTINTKYKASVWVYLPDTTDGYGSNISDQSLNVVRLQYKRNGTVIKEEYRKLSMKARNQYLLSLDFEPQDGTMPVEIVCRNQNAGRPVYFDDFRVHPIHASFSSCVYDIPSGKLTYILDQNNFFTHYTYNNKGELIRTSRELLNYPTERTLIEKGINYGKAQ